MVEEITKRTFKILVLDDPTLVEFFPEFFPEFLKRKYPRVAETCDFEFVIATNVQQGSALIKQNCFNAVIMEVVLAHNPEVGVKRTKLQEERMRLSNEIYADKQDKLEPASLEAAAMVRFLLEENIDQISACLSFSGGFEILAGLEDAKLPIVFVTTQPEADIANGMTRFPLMPWFYFDKPTEMEPVAEALLELLSLKKIR